MTTPTEEFARIRGYLQQQAEQKTIDELVVRVQEGLDQLAAAARAIEASRFALVPPGEEWSPAQCLQHAAASNMHVAQQVLYVAHTGELPIEGEPPLPADREQILARQAEAIQSLYEHVREARPDAYLDVKWEHPFFGDLNWREWLLFLRIHAIDHARQLTAMKEAMG
jgi:hypothetical protein